MDDTFVVIAEGNTHMTNETMKDQTAGGGRGQGRGRGQGGGRRRRSGAAGAGVQRDGAMTVAAKLVWADAKAGAAAASQLLTGATGAVRELVANLHASNDEATVQASFALEAMVMASSAPGQGNRRACLASALAKSLGEAADDVARNVLIRALQLIGGDDEVPALAKCLELEGAFDTALLALRQIGTEKAYLAIKNSLARAGGRRRALLAAALGDFDDPCCHPDIPGLVAGALAKADPADAPMLWAALARLGHAGVAPALAKALKGTAKSRAAVARGCLSLLARNCRSEDDAAIAIAELFKAEPDSVSSLMALQDNMEEDEDSVPYLLGLMTSDSKVMRETVAGILMQGYVGSSVTEKVISFYLQEGDGGQTQAGMELRQTIIRLLGQRGDQVARPFLLSLLHDREAAIRKSALAAIECLLGPLDRRVLAATILEQ